MKLSKKIFTALALVCISAVSFAGTVKITKISKPAKLTKVKVGIFRSKPYRLTKFPDFMKGLPCIFAPRGTGKKPGISFSFTIDKPATVYILVHKRGKFVPEGWERTDLKAEWVVNKKPYFDAVFKKDFPAGQVVIPAHKGQNKGKTYGVGNLAVIKSK